MAAAAAAERKIIGRRGRDQASPARRHYLLTPDAVLKRPAEIHGAAAAALSILQNSGRRDTALIS